MPWLEVKGMSLSGNSIGRESGTLTRKREALNAGLELEVSASDLLGDSVWDSGSGSILRPNHSFAGFLVCELPSPFLLCPRADSAASRHHLFLGSVPELP